MSKIKRQQIRTNEKPYISIFWYSGVYNHESGNLYVFSVLVNYGLNPDLKGTKVTWGEVPPDWEAAEEIIRGQFT